MLVVDFADVLHQVPAVGVPGGILLDSQRARSGGHYTCRILLREHNAIHRHRFGGDVGGGNNAVLNTFRILTILRLLRGSQAAFADKTDLLSSTGDSCEMSCLCTPVRGWPSPARFVYSEDGYCKSTDSQYRQLTITT